MTDERKAEATKLWKASRDVLIAAWVLEDLTLERWQSTGQSDPYCQEGEDWTMARELRELAGDFELNAYGRMISMAREEVK